MIFTISLADLIIRIESIYDEVYEMCGQYMLRDAAICPDIDVCIAPADIDAERERSRQQDLMEGRMPQDYPDPYLETLAVYRRIAEKAPALDVFLLHGSAVAVGDKCWLFTAPSGVGKTTHTKLWLDNIEGSYVVNGDKPLIRRCEVAGDTDHFEICGTPWSGKEGWNTNVIVPLEGIIFVGRGAENNIVRAGAAEILPQLISQTYRPESVDAQKKTLELLKELCTIIPFYRLSCNMEPEAAVTAFNGVNAG